ncbi:chemotaxis protein [Candidatus Magnetobacterium casense]|uniref:Chemotaxis protein CheV n=1 Tax=Candidatus Magnetobacterium casense TaxID=1455061 RepID=A0ABS6RVP0_9BACT|nr:chemotaxis protein [Candidatus Magnetobacterium casensis]MBV6340700.1 chemotaxis protein CheV [Candidatus Magnetobacterium casensis]
MDIIEQIKSQILLETGTNEFEILEFYIYEQSSVDTTTQAVYFGMNVAKVMQVIESPNLEQKDYSQNPCFLGTIPLRNLIVPVIDLSEWLGIERVRTDNEIVIITEFSQSVQGFLVSGVTEIHRVVWKDVIPPNEFINRIGSSSIVGMVIKDDHFIQLLDLEHIISDLNPESTEEMWQTSVRAQKNYIALIADDSPTIRLMLKKNLQIANFSTHIVNNGEEALVYLKQIAQKASDEGRDISEFVNIVISDIEMPQLDGFTLTRNIKEDPRLKRLPVILYSSIITDELRHKGESVKADYQVSKPDLNKMAEMAIRLIETTDT